MSAAFLLASTALGTAALHAQDYPPPQSQGQQGQGSNRQPSRASFPRPEARGDNSHNSLSDSVRRVQQREPGVRVLSAERVPFDGRDINRIKYVDERGRVRYMDDAGNNRRRSVPRNDDAAPTQAPPARDDNPSQP